MKKTHITRMLCIIAIFYTALVSCSSKNEEKPKEDYARLAQNETRRLEVDTLGDVARKKHDSEMIATEKRRNNYKKTFSIEKATIKGNPEQRFLGYLREVDHDGFISLANVYFYMRGSTISAEHFELDEVTQKILTYVGIKRNDTATWSTANEKLIKKLSSTLNATDKKAVAKSFTEHARLIDSLSNLNDADMQTLIVLLDKICTMGMYEEKTIPYLRKEYNALNKVWHMPKLVTVHPDNERYTFLLLGKSVKYVTYDDLTWNTRYLCRYQFAVGIFHRRCRDTKATTPEARRQIAQKIASVMRESAALLQ